jgi:hypothetical protein
VKVFAVSAPSVKLQEFVPVFHAWIQKQIVKDHLLIDVHDYSHIYNGPGILLVAHEGNFSLDMEGGRLGLLYHRKQPLAGSLEERLRIIVDTALEGSLLLEQDSAAGAKLRFNRDELLIVTNDRLLAPNEEKTFSELRPVLNSALQPILGRELELTPAHHDSRDRFAVYCKSRR